jgi:glucuronate isomerase
VPTPWQPRPGSASFAVVLHPDRLLPAEPGVRDVARRLYEATGSLPIVSPHGHYSPVQLAGNALATTADLSSQDAEDLFAKVVSRTQSPEEAELFRGQMLVEMASMSLEDGLVLEIHAGAWRNHNSSLWAHFGPDMGADIPQATDYVATLKPLLDRFGNEPTLPAGRKRSRHVG